MPNNAVDICSAALHMLGHKGFNSFDEAQEHAVRCRYLYPQIRDFVLRSHPWNCAIKRVILDPSTEAPPFDWANSFALPGDCLRTLSVGDDGRPDDYQLEGRNILANTNQLKLRYIHRATEAIWDSMLVHAVTMAMRQVLAYPTTASTSLEQLVMQAIAGILQQARAVDGQENPPETFGNEMLFGEGF